jgi:hypothetical protein
LPFTIRVHLGDVRSRFIAKGRAGRGYRAVARNGRVLLASSLPLPELTGAEMRVRFQVWHRVILPGEPPQAWGLLLCAGSARDRSAQDDARGIYRAHLVKQLRETDDLGVDVGGGLSLAFRRV